MNENEFMEFMEEKFSLKSVSLNLLLSIFQYATKENHCIHNYILEEMLRTAFGDDITEEEYRKICDVE